MNRRPSVCVEIEADLMASAMGEAEPAISRRVNQHVEQCAPCRDDLERYRAIEGEVAAMRSHGPAVCLPAADLARAREQLESRLLDLRSRLVAYEIFPSPLGDVLIARSEQGVVLLEYLEAHGAKGLRGSRLARAAGLEPVEDRGEVEGLYRDFRDYLDGRSSRLGWPLDLRLVRSPFHRAVLQATAEIPYGAVVSYSGLARGIGRPRAVRAVAQALRWNPLPVAIPCHRVIGVSGALVGYAGGETGRKQKLLAVEGVPLAPLPLASPRTPRPRRSKARPYYRIRRDAMYVRAPGDMEYCLPSCPSTDVFPVGGELFGTRERAEAVGLAPCTACRPDLHPLAG